MGKENPKTDADEALARELNRARRHERACTLITIEAHDGPLIDRIDALLGSILREHDVVVAAPTGSGLVLLAPETDANGRNVMVMRIHSAILAELGAEAMMSAATFPEDGVTVGALISKARQSQPQPTTYEPPPSAIGPTTRHVHTRAFLRHSRARRGTDIVIGCVGLAVLSPLLALVAVAIPLDSPGPILYRQRRTGRDGAPFEMWKFRSMVRDADERRKEVASLNRLDSANFKIEGDPRVTRVGRIIRRFSIDELPQLLNVIRGEMTLVGPRPTSLPPEEHELWQTERLDVVPGLTGMWQLSGRGTTLFPDRCRLDIRYARGRGPGLDARLIAGTLPAVITGRGVT
jgi:lipopolysaccharide/colanic/teichoic acid biosynthesis glycosyltransferase